MEYLKLSLHLFLLFLSGSNEKILIPNITNPQQIVWVNLNEVSIVKEENIYLVDVWNMDIQKKGERLPNEFVGIDEEGNVLLCSFENFVISSKDDYSTRIVIKGKEYKYFETIRPIYLRDNTLVAMTGVDFLEQHIYKINLDDGSKEELKEMPKMEEKGNLYVSEDIYGNLYINYNIREIVKIIYTNLRQL